MFITISGVGGQLLRILCAWSFAALLLGAHTSQDHGAAARPAKEFDPKVHGFGCQNSFEGSPLPPVLRGTASQTVRAITKGVELELGLPQRFGLCGGMSLAAADYFLAGRTVPFVTAPPAQDTPLYDYFYQRQTDSMGQFGVMALKFLRWMDLPDTTENGESTASLTALELPAVLARIRDGHLVPLGLVLKSTQSGRLWENHQVLAFGCDELPGGVVEVSVYDPNFPGNDKVVLRVTPVEKVATVVGGDTRFQVMCEREAGKGRLTKVRGFFVMPYTYRSPPADVGSPR